MSWFRRKNGSGSGSAGGRDPGADASFDGGRRQIDWGTGPDGKPASLDDLDFEFDLDLSNDPDFRELPPEPSLPEPSLAEPPQPAPLQPGPVHHEPAYAPPSEPRFEPRPDARLEPRLEPEIEPAMRQRPVDRAPAPAIPAAPRAQAPAEPVPTEGADGWLVVDNVKKSFKSRPVVRGASLAVRRGEAVGLLGPNGAGKTTVFYMITGLIPADTGRITLDGHDITRLPMYRRARLGIGYLPQEASIFRGMTVEENIRAVLEVVEPNRRRRREQLDDLLEEFSITRLRKSPAIALSGGERRRCEIARALAGRPTFMLLDEPFAGIDPIAVGDIQLLVRHLTARGIGVLITDHNVRETLGLIDRAYIIHSGQVLMEGTPNDIVASPEVRRLYLGEGFTL